MGMSASQGRLLFMTARLSNNEFEQQAVAYSKQRLAANTEQINDEYLDAMEKTKYQVLTGYNGTEATFEDLTYNQLTGMNNVALGKQYLVQDNKGKVVVSSAIAKAFEKGNGDFNVFLANVGGGYTQCDIDTSDDYASMTAIHEAWDKYLKAVGRSIDDVNGEHILDFGFNNVKVKNNENAGVFDGYVTYNSAYITHEYNDRNADTYQYLNLYKEHNFDTSDTSLIDRDTPELTPTTYYINNYTVFPKEYTDAEGNTQAVLCFQTEEQAKNDEYTFLGLQLDSYNSKTGEYKCTYGDNTYDKLYIVINPNDLSSVYVTPDATSKLLYNQQEKSYFLHFTDAETKESARVDGEYELVENSKPITYEGTNQEQRNLYEYAVSITAAYANRSNPNYSALTHDDAATTYYRNIFNEMRTKGYTTVDDETKLKDTNWFVTQLKAGKITISYFSNVDQRFIGTSLDDDESITEKEDKSAIAIAEQNYTTRMNRIESQDKQFDMQLSKLEAEHSALTTEYDAVVKVISKNVEKSFNTFS